MARIRPVLTTPTHSSGSQVSVTIVNQWMADLRSIPYGFTALWKTPAEAQSGAPADCKAKAVALYEKMRENGATNVRLVIGKRTSTSRVTHAWLAWDTDNGSLVLDPTFNWAACTPAQAGKRNYQPFMPMSAAKNSALLPPSSRKTNSGVARSARERPFPKGRSFRFPGAQLKSSAHCACAARGESCSARFGHETVPSLLFQFCCSRRAPHLEMRSPRSTGRPLAIRGQNSKSASIPSRATVRLWARSGIAHAWFPNSPVGGRSKANALLYTYTSDAFGRIPAGTTDRDRLVEMKADSFLIQAANGDRRRYFRTQ